MTNLTKSICKFAVLVCLAIIAVAAIDLSALAQSQADAPKPPAVNQLAHDIFQQLVEINTTDSVGNVTTAAEAMAKRLLDAGFTDQDEIVAASNAKKKNVDARFRGAS